MTAELFEKTDEKPTETAPKPHYHGHRDRLRARLRDSGIDALQDYEILELILFSAIPRKDVKPIAKELLASFGSLSAIFHAPHQDLMRIGGISENTALLFKALTGFAHRAIKEEIRAKPILNSWTRLIEYCTTTMGHEKREHFRILFLNRKNELIADEIQTSGTVDQTQAYPREIMKRALELGATALILVHNHPSGDPKPSKADITMTEQIILAGEPFSIVIHDHIIVSKNGHSSFKSMGLI